MWAGIPYFMTNKDWYREVPDDSKEYEEYGRGFALTDKAPQEAIDSYNEFYAEDIDEFGGVQDI